MAQVYRYRMVTYAQQIYDSLSREGKGAVNRALREVCRDPEAGDFSRRDHTWTYSTADVVLQYSVEHNLVTITVLRIMTMK